jgi:hypothetical protein
MASILKSYLLVIAMSWKVNFASTTFWCTSRFLWRLKFA